MNKVLVQIRMMALVALCLMVLSGSTAVAKPDLVVEDTTATGTIKSIADDGGSFVVKPAQGAEVTVKVNASTKYKIDANDSNFAEVVKVGRSVVATLNADGVATEVVVREGRKGAIIR